MPPVYDQGSLGSCTTQALCGLNGYIQPNFNGSRLFLYYCERVLEQTTNTDSGAALFDGIQSLQKNGVCLERMWPYITSKFAEKPPESCFQNALLHQALKTLKMQNINSSNLSAMKNCLVYGLRGPSSPFGLPKGLPFVIGFQVYESFESAQVARTGIVPMPKPGEQCLGGHAVCVVGFDDSKQWFIYRNSWSNQWGIGDYFYMPYAYFINHKLASDAWTIILME